MCESESIRGREAIFLGFHRKEAWAYIISTADHSLWTENGLVGGVNLPGTNAC